MRVCTYVVMCGCVFTFTREQVYIYYVIIYIYVFYVLVWYDRALSYTTSLVFVGDGHVCV
jgi:hypothetical protein